MRQGINVKVNKIIGEDGKSILPSKVILGVIANII